MYCVDVDECGVRRHTCQSEEETCENTVGSFVCRPSGRCRKGFSRDDRTQACNGMWYSRVKSLGLFINVWPTLKQQELRMSDIYVLVINIDDLDCWADDYFLIIIGPALLVPYHHNYMFPQWLHFFYLEATLCNRIFYYIEQLFMNLSFFCSLHTKLNISERPCQKHL